ncbi:hypothetical protein TCAL_01151 [Tigriopus californicus]|uniref:Eukaryotic translation initiation factor 2A n=1 Tax=Tigriopus californicus TaxID=6832 RepID=A0A553P4R6_TIGCA|nr:eukaryotic translation initiation factor 2A-like [Tigriopus californicus]TRY72652.1 hypothetical protein TCAL_01151 [Tigriopus californicus]
MSLSLSVRGSRGLSLFEPTEGTQTGGPVTTWQPASDPDQAIQDGAKNVRVMAYSPAGDMFAWSNGVQVQVVGHSEGTWRPVAQIPHAKASHLIFSPLGRILATWEVFSTKAGQNPEPNLHLWNPKSGEKLASFTQKKLAFWCPQWARDESVCCLRSPNNEVLFFRDNNFKDVDKRLSVAKMESFSFASTTEGQHHVICFIPGQKGGPSTAQLYAYPKFNPETDVVAKKSFFQSDRMEVYWSWNGKNALLLTQSEVDKTGASYYGKQQLHFVNTKGDTNQVHLAKDGPIHALQWSPRDSLYCVVYGFMPAKATLFNQKCEKVFDFGTGARNTVLFNPQGNLLMIGGFGNLRGNVEMWAVQAKREVCQFEATDATDIRWSPNGKYLMTSTCAPRLRQGNGFKVWHYTSSLIFEHPIETPGEELWEVAWQNAPPEKFLAFQIQYKPVEGIQPKQPVASKEAYRPPGMRNKVSTFKLHDEDEPAENVRKPGAVAAPNEELSRSAAKNRRRRMNRKDRAGGESGTAAANGREESPGEPKRSLEVTGDPIKDKKLRKLNDKLVQIAKLKERIKAGETLELNQLEKIEKEQELTDEVNKLKL